MTADKPPDPSIPMRVEFGEFWPYFSLGDIVTEDEDWAYIPRELADHYRAAKQAFEYASNRLTNYLHGRYGYEMGPFERGEG